LMATGTETPRTYTRFDGSPGRVDEPAEIDQDCPLPADGPAVVQVSGWELVKDQRGLASAFAEVVSPDHPHLVIAGPSTAGSPEEAEERVVLEELAEERRALHSDVASRIHLVQIPIDDRDDNATIVNALQRRADVVVHKPLHEAFGLSVAEAMWKGRPVIASRVGGIADQIVDGESGVLVDDPSDGIAVAREIDLLLADPGRARALGTAASKRIAERFSVVNHLAEYLELIQRVRRD
jgi:trehalose synthase